MNNFFKILIFLVLSFSVTNLLDGLFEDLFLSIFFFLICFFYFNKYKYVNKILITAFIIRFILSILSYSGIWYQQGANDDALYFIENGLAYSNFDFSQIFLNFVNSGTSIYNLFLGFIFKIFDKSILFVIYINVFFSSLIVLYVYKLSSLLYNKKAGYLAALFATFVPYLLFLGVTIIREPIITLLLIVSIFYFVKYSKSFLFKDMILSIILLFFGIGMHGAIILSLIVLIINIGLITFKRSQSLLHKIRFLLIMIITTISLISVLQSEFRIYKLHNFQDRKLDKLYDDILRHSGYAIKDNTYRSDIKIEKLLDYIIVLPETFIPFLLEPYPWRIIELARYFLWFFGPMVWLVLFYLFLSNRKLLFNNKINIYIILFCFISLYVYSLGSSQINQAIRHNHKFVPIIISIMSIYFIKYASKFGLGNKINSIPS